MKRIRAWHVSIFTAGCALALGSACGTGNANPGTGGTGGSTTTGSTSSSTGSNPTTTGSTSNGNSSSSSGFPAQTGVCKGAGTLRPHEHAARRIHRRLRGGDDLAGLVVVQRRLAGMLTSSQIMQVAGGAAGTAHAGHYAGTGAKTSTMRLRRRHGLQHGDRSQHWASTASTSLPSPASRSGRRRRRPQSISLNFVLPSTNMASENDAGMQTGGDCTMTATTTRGSPSRSRRTGRNTRPRSPGRGGSATVEKRHPGARVAQPRLELGLHARRDRLLRGHPADGPRRQLLDRQHLRRRLKE